jgi:uncharacterized protein YjbI with pentapeptide repeats
MMKDYFLKFGLLTALILLTSCGPKFEPGVDLSGKNLKGQDLRGVDLTNANLSGANLRNAKMGSGGKVNLKPEHYFDEFDCEQWLNDTTFLALCDTNQVKIWDTEQEDFVRTIKLPDNNHSETLSVSPDGATVILYEQLWDTKTNTLYPNSFALGSARWSSDGSYFLLAGRDTAFLWDVVNNRLVDEVENMEIFERSSAWMNQSNILVYVNKNNKNYLEFWNAETNERTQRFDSGFRSNVLIEVSFDDKMIVVVGSVEGDLVYEGAIINAESGTYIQYLEKLDRVCESCDLNSIAWAPDQPLIAGGASNGTIVFWNSESGVISHYFKTDPDDQNIDFLQWSSDGKFLISQHGNYSPLKLWNMRKMLETTILTDANLTNADLRGADMSGLDLNGTTLAGADLSAANLQGANLSGLDLQAVKFTNADLSGVDFTNSDLSGADLSGAFIAQAKFSNTNLKNADLQGIEPVEYLLISVCDGTGVEAMPTYTNQPGIHPMVMFNEIGRIHQWNDGIDWNDEFFENWIPSKDQLPEIVACVDEYIETISSCEYRQDISTVTIPLLQSKMDITLRDAHTGSIFATTTIKGELAQCPFQVTVGTESIGGTPVELMDAATWLSEFIEK